MVEKVLVHLRDGRHLIGVLRSYDQYGPSYLLSLLSYTESKKSNSDADGGVGGIGSIANLVLTQTFERLHHVKSSTFGQMDRGVFLIRGENVVLLGEIVRSSPSLSPSS